MEQEKIKINKDGELLEATIIDTFKSNNNNEYAVYSFNEEEIMVSKISENESEMKLEDIPEEDNDYVNKMMEEILEDL